MNNKTTSKNNKKSVSKLSVPLVQFIKWSKPEEELTYIGILFGQTETTVDLYTREGLLVTLDRTDGTFEDSNQEEFLSVPLPQLQPIVNTQVIVVNNGSKAQKAREIFINYYGRERRCDIIRMFIKHALLTKDGGSTYYNNFVKEIKDGKLVIPENQQDMIFEEETPVVEENQQVNEEKVDVVVEQQNEENQQDNEEKVEETV